MVVETDLTIVTVEMIEAIGMTTAVVEIENIQETMSIEILARIDIIMKIAEIGQVEKNVHYVGHPVIQ